ncbi:hypothetical protein PFISCL1PPCAC_5569, partial [Pristionchus fissidentatus]
FLQMSSFHPWTKHLNVRSSPRLSSLIDPSIIDPPPYRYNDKENINGPADKATELRERITLSDIVAFRHRSQKKKKK